MRNAVIGIGFIVVLGIAALLGWFVWQSTPSEEVLSGGAVDNITDTAQSEVSSPDATEENVNEENSTNEANENDDNPAAINDENAPVSGLESTLRFVYLWNNRLGLWQGGDDQTLVTAASNYPPQISSDGHLIAFVRDGGLWVMNDQGGEERLLVSESEIEGMGTDDTAARLHRFAWLPGTHHLLFNTALNIDMGFVLTDDLYRVEVDSLDLVELLPRGTGGEFTIAPNGESIAVVSPTEIRLIATDGAELRPHFAYEPVLTYSEFAYYPQPVWAEDSSRIAVAIPHPEGFLSPQEPAVIWSLAVGADEPAVLDRIQADAPSFWIDPTLEQIAYMQAVGSEVEAGDEIVEGAEGEAPPAGYAIAVARLDGSEPYAHFEGGGYFLGWSPDGTHFTVATPGGTETIQLGTIGETELIPLAGLNHAFSHQVTWLDTEHFIVVGGDSMDTVVALGNIAGELTPLMQLEAGSFSLDPVSLDTPE